MSYNCKYYNSSTMDTTNVRIGDVLVLSSYKHGSKTFFSRVKNITKTGRYRMERLVSTKTLVSEKK